MKKIYFILFALSTILFSCKETPVPRPYGHVRMAYPEAEYQSMDQLNLPYTFELSKYAVFTERGEDDSNISYPGMKATLYLTYKPVTDNFDVLLNDVQKLTYEHTVKASGIVEQPFSNENDKVYGTLYEVEGNAASNLQFFVTDSTSHLLSGSLYFYSTPNYDSILPAVNYIKADVKHLMETVKWQ